MKMRRQIDSIIYITCEAAEVGGCHMVAMAYGQNHKLSHELLTRVQFKEVTVLCSYGRSSGYCMDALGLAKNPPEDDGKLCQ